MATDLHLGATVERDDVEASPHMHTRALRMQDDCNRYGNDPAHSDGIGMEGAAEPSITIDPVTPADEPFVFELYSSTRAQELALTGWPASMQEQFLRMQFAAQTHSYRTQFPDAHYSVIRRNGVAVGRIIVNRTVTELHLVDIAVITDHRGRKIGSRLMGRLLQEAKRTGKTVRLHVERMNPALRWYKRLGFKCAGGNEIYLEMFCRPGATAETK